MKKTYLALAVLGAFAGAASAQTSVTTYGVVDMGVVSESGGAGGSVTKLTSGVFSGSRLGFKGSEDLGGGLSATFKLETGLLPDTGGFAQGNRAFGRHSSVGLSGSFGSVEFGRFYNVVTNTVGDFDPFEGGLEGAYSNIMNWSTRMNNAIYYRSPVMNGFSGELAYGFGEVAGNMSASREFGAVLGYANGPLALKLVHQNKQNATATNALKFTNLNGSYNFGPAKLFVVYNVNKDDVAVDSNDTLLGVSAPAGAAGTFMASYIRHKDKSSLGQDANQAAIGYSYALSKRTSLNASYARISNTNGAGFTVGNANEVGTGDKGFAVGIRHKF